MTIQFYRKNVYGNEHMYILDEKLARTITCLTGHKTFLKDSKIYMERLGHTFVEVLAPNLVTS